MNHESWVTVACTINGSAQQFTLSPATPLSTLLRSHGLLSIKQGCSVGECGACTVLIDGVAIDSCLYLASWVDGKSISTLEGESVGGEISKIQQAYAKSGSVQCGFCTPGLVMATKALLAKPHQKPFTVQEIRRGLAGNLCRCTGYQMIVDTVRACEQE
ncbi:xanthine dehydrogenase iron sulfur-binding subunit XdhC [Yokenella regensburgei]|jgi:xanthine dehydrogenase iron-sulfur-binding subunit|uniref:Nicotinate dehydrogenase small FeS subunit n=1 Tax=Yokenella regensburgei TaxID=158877 RepID=A0AB38FVC3_9ENTR|nr:xanthine dehydrogenase iron sulfur-binding subunit XdhC [Yokenella regensburgei]KFD25254.1 xanthine dehydrogenase iron-sulfur subunit [Yokenella regensburgei ATCC 49455]MDQ4429470.1 xanthine dehydrogenase iron sulfur-binding subunit XdhC [Yokenella regensburgei]MDR2217176.1 xanthine dehydrogenase iron sulfur-binding subunit XdhC [Yokenella regensburgei]RKR53882.1 xanthine dehydrogenase iron-sulfur-binding subunit [Yokenella regensburgei]SQA63288.1 Nicotinate dehydrogenase small FeS subunit 